MRINVVRDENGKVVATFCGGAGLQSCGGSPDPPLWRDVDLSGQSLPVIRAG